MVKRIAFSLLAVTILLVCATTLVAQGSPETHPPSEADKNAKGFRLYQRFDGSNSSQAFLLELTSTMGYNLNKHFGVDLGLPIYFVHPPSTTPSTGGKTTSTSTSGTALSNAFVDMRLSFDTPLVNYASTLTGYAPTGNTQRGLSSGRVTFTWDNRFEHEFFDRVTPFIDVAPGNALPDTRYLHRPYSTLGKVVHFESGSAFTIWESLALNGSLYADVPWGEQRIFSRVIPPLATRTSSAISRTIFQTLAQAKGDSSLTRDNGYTIGLSANPTSVIDMDVGYTRSVLFRLDTFSFGIGFDLSGIFRKMRAPIKTVTP